MRRVWTPSERRTVLENYAANGAQALAVTLGRSADSVSGQARRCGLRCPDSRKRIAQRLSEKSRTVNTKFFEESTPETAFVVGYIWACGGIKTKHCHVIRLVCSRDDPAPLKHVRDVLGSKHSIQIYQYHHVLEVANRCLVKTLVNRFGVPPGRRTDGDPPQIPDELMSSFAKGHLLGSGRSGPSYIRWQGHRSVIRWLAERIVTLSNVPEPTFGASTQRIGIRWNEAPHLQAINSWLGNLL